MPFYNVLSQLLSAYPCGDVTLSTTREPGVSVYITGAAQQRLLSYHKYLVMQSWYELRVFGNLFIVNMCIYINGNNKIRKFDLSGTLMPGFEGTMLS